VKKIGLFGGSFNPIHLGHLRAALEVQTAFGMETIMMIPSARPPHKFAKNMAPAADRLEMVRLATAEIPELTASDAELRRPGLSYTVETIERFQAEKADADLFLLIGLDAFLEYDTWHRYPDLFQLVPIIVMPRPDHAMTDLTRARHLMEKQLTASISTRYRYDASPPRFMHPVLKPVYIFEVTRLDISASRIRQLVKTDRSIRFLVPDTVRQFIIRKGLYQ